MKPEKLILEPYRTFGGYDILKHLFTSDEYHLHPNDNFELLLSYLKSKYKRTDIGVDGRSFGVQVSFDNGEAMFNCDDVNHKYYLFPIRRREGIRRLRSLEEYMNNQPIGISMNIDINEEIDAGWKTCDYVGFTIHDRTIPKYKRAFLHLYKNIPWILNRILPKSYHLYKYTETPFGKNY